MMICFIQLTLSDIYDTLIQAREGSPSPPSCGLPHCFDEQDDGSHKLQDCGNKVYVAGRLNFVAAFLSPFRLLMTQCRFFLP